MLDTALALKLTSWLWENTAIALYGAGLLWATKLAIRRLKAVVEASTTRLLKKLRQINKRLDMRKCRWIRKYRFDTVWIDREVSRAHTSQIICLLWFGLWIIAMGLKETFLVTNTTLAKSPATALISALPLYFFEIAWMWHASRASELIKYRQKVRIWRWK